MLVTLSGMVTLVRLSRPENASSPMLVTLSGITVVLHPSISVLVSVSIIALQLFLLSYVLLFGFTEMLVRLVQPENA